jgi:hypothetical protein
VRNKLLSKILLSAALLAGWANADVMYTLPAGSSYVDSSSTYDVSGFVDFFLTDCSANGQSNCILNVELENTQTGTEVANQAISGLTFE